MKFGAQKKRFTFAILSERPCKLSENVWVLGCGATRQQKRKDRATQPMDHGRLRWAKNNDNTMSRSKSLRGPAPMYPPSMKDPPWM